MEATPRGSLVTSSWTHFVIATVLLLGGLTANSQEPRAKKTQASRPGPIDEAIADYLKKHPEVLDEKISKHLKEHPEEVAGGLSGGYDNGFYLKTTKGNFDLKLNFLGQIWYDHITNDDRNPSLTTGPAGFFPSDGDSFLLRRSELKFSGHMFTDRLAWRFMFDPARAIGGRGSPSEAFPENKRTVKDLFLDFTLIKESDPIPVVDTLTARIGQTKTPQTMEGYNHAGWVDFPERSIIGFTFGDFREQGAVLFGTGLDKCIEFFGSAFNGNGTNSFRDDNDQKDLIGRLVFHPFAKYIADGDKAAAEAKKESPPKEVEKPLLRDLSIGVSGSTGVDGRRSNKFHQDAGGAELNLEYWISFLRAEWYRGKPQGLNQSSTGPTSAAPQVSGWYVTLGVDIFKNLQAAVRYQQFNPNLDKVNDLVDVTSLGLTYFFDPSHGSKSHGAKIQAAYNFNSVKSATVNTPTGVLADGDQFTLAFQVDF
jgi:hypothetical protein